MTHRASDEGEGERSPRAGLQERLREVRDRRAQDEARARSAAPPNLTRLEQLGLTPGVALGLIIIASIVMVAGVVLTITAPPQAQAPAPDESATAIPPTLMPAARPPAEEAVDDYLVLVRQGMYAQAWGRTTAKFQSENYPDGLAAFEQAWTASPEMEVVSKKVVLRGDDKATVIAELRNTGTDARYTNSYRLVFDGASGLWLIDAVTQVW
jgi:hypothetical protein